MIGRRPTPHGAITCERQPDGSVICYIWNADLQTWTYEHPDDHGERGLGFGCVVMLAMVAIAALGFWVW